MEYFFIGLPVGLFLGYLIGRLQTQFKYDRVLLRRGLGRHGMAQNKGKF